MKVTLSVCINDVHKLWLCCLFYINNDLHLFWQYDERGLGNSQAMVPTICHWAASNASCDQLCFEFFCSTLDTFEFDEIIVQPVRSWSHNNWYCCFRKSGKCMWWTRMSSCCFKYFSSRHNLFSCWDCTWWARMFKFPCCNCTWWARKWGCCFKSFPSRHRMFPYWCSAWWTRMRGCCFE